jgi:hypothetical protein
MWSHKVADNIDKRLSDYLAGLPFDFFETVC